MSAVGRNVNIWSNQILSDDSPHFWAAEDLVNWSASSVVSLRVQLKISRPGEKKNATILQHNVPGAENPFNKN